MLREVKPLPEGGPRVLLAGVEEPFAFALEAELEALGWSVQRTRGGREALRRWGDLSPDVIVADLDGGDMDALEFLLALAPGARPPVVACTRGVGRADPTTLKELGVDALFAKPCRVDRLVDAIGELAPRRPAVRAAGPAVHGANA